MSFIHSLSKMVSKLLLTAVLSALLVLTFTVTLLGTDNTNNTNYSSNPLEEILGGPEGWPLPDGYDPGQGNPDSDPVS